MFIETFPAVIVSVVLLFSAYLIFKDQEPRNIHTDLLHLQQQLNAALGHNPRFINLTVALNVSGCGTLFYRIHNITDPEMQLLINTVKRINSTYSITLVLQEF